MFALFIPLLFHSRKTDSGCKVGLNSQRSNKNRANILSLNELKTLEII